MQVKRCKAEDIVNNLRRGTSSSLGYRPPAPEATAAGTPSASLRAVQHRLSMETTTTWTVDTRVGEGQQDRAVRRWYCCSASPA